MVATKQIIISTNKICVQVYNPSLTYTQKYEHWMQDAVSNFVKMFDPCDEIVLKKKNNILYKKCQLTGFVNKKYVSKPCRVIFLPLDHSIELLFDTIVYDKGIF